MMQLVLWLGSTAIAINFILQGVKMLSATRRLESYLVENHPRQYQEIYMEGWLGKAFFWPFTTQPNPVRFIISSTEDFGDAKVKILRAHIKQAFVLTIGTMVALGVWLFCMGILVPVLFRS